VQLKHYYWVIRVEGRDKAKRRRYYRYVAKEKLRLAEMNIEQDLINAVCKYLSSLKPTHGERFNSLLLTPSKQISFNFCYIFCNIDTLSKLSSSLFT
jgi:hypothetical protein